MSADLDREIDRAVRAMLDAEPPAAFRARVHSRIEDASAPVGSAFVASAFVASAFVASAFRRKLLFIATPIAVAVTILIAILLPSRQRVAPPAPSAPPSMAQANPTRTPLAPVTTVPASDRHSSRTTPPPDRRARREEQRIAAA